MYNYGIHGFFNRHDNTARRTVLQKLTGTSLEALHSGFRYDDKIADPEPRIFPAFRDVADVALSLLDVVVQFKVIFGQESEECEFAFTGNCFDEYSILDVR